MLNMANLRGKLAMFLLGIWLIVMGLIPLTNIGSPALNTVMAIVAIVVGILVILEIRTAPFKNLGRLVLAVWLILMGLIPLLSLSFQSVDTVMAVLAIVAGALLLIGR